MLPLPALVLQESGLHRSIAMNSLSRLGYSAVAISSAAMALARLRSLGAVRLLLCDLRSNPTARLDFLQTVACERLANAVIITDELAPGCWPALKQLLSLQGLPAVHLGTGPATHETLLSLLRGFDPARTPGRPILASDVTPSDEEVACALRQGGFRAVLQPKVSVSCGEIHGYEVLARWLRPDGEVLLPGRFLAALRRCGLIDALLFDMMEQALRQLDHCGGCGLGLAFNLEPEQIARHGFAKEIEHQLQRLGLDPGNVTFELTESGLVQAPIHSLHCLLHLRLLGCGLAIDDFGSGHSSLQRLMELPFSELKLDRSFLVEADDPRRHAVLANAVALGRTLGLPVVAEGVETEDQLHHLQHLGCDYAQGFLFGTPVITSMFNDRMMTCA